MGATTTTISTGSQQDTPQECPPDDSLPGVLFPRPPVPRTQTSVFLAHDPRDRTDRDAVVASDRRREFVFHSPDYAGLSLSHESTDLARVRAKIRQQIADADYFVCLVNERAAQDAWVLWELIQAMGMKKPIIGIPLRRTASLRHVPDLLKLARPVWANSINLADLKEAIERTASRP